MCTTTQENLTFNAKSSQKKKNNPGYRYVVGNQHKDIEEHKISKAPQTGGEKVAPTHEQNS